MGARVHSIYRISPSRSWHLYAFVFAIPPWDDAYDWFEEKFVTVSRALGVDGVLLMPDDEAHRGQFDEELIQAYGVLDEQIRHLPSLRQRGIIITNINPHTVRESIHAGEGEVCFLPVRGSDPEEITQIVSAIVEAARTADLSGIKKLSAELCSADNESITRIVAESVLLQPNVAGVGYDFGKLLTRLAERREHRRRKFDR